MNQNKAVFLDRDGVINQAIIRDGKPYPPNDISKLVISDDVLPALTQLKKSGFLLIVVTNQPDIARGKTSQSTVDAINQHLMQQLPLDDIRICAHDDNDQCLCRKPLPGLLTKAAEAYDISLKDSYMIGDRWRDVEAGQAAKCQSVFLDYGYLEKQPKNPDYITQSLQQAVNWINMRNKND